MDEAKKEFGVRWMEFDRNGRAVAKEKVFTSEARLAAFVKKLEAKDNFYQFVSWL
jgi:hypothetical protein